MTLILPIFTETARRRETIKRIEKTLFHNPDLYPFGLAAQSRKNKERLMIQCLSKFDLTRLSI